MDFLEFWNVVWPSSSTKIVQDKPLLARATKNQQGQAQAWLIWSRPIKIEASPSSGWAGLGGHGH